MANVRWVALPGYVGHYDINKVGGVRSVDRIVTCVDGRKLPYKSKIIKQQINKSGYKHVGLCNKAGRDERKSLNMQFKQVLWGTRLSGLLYSETYK